MGKSSMNTHGGNNASVMCRPKPTFIVKIKIRLSFLSSQVWD